MALMIASDINLDMAGEPLLAGVSFKLERRDRMTLAGRNGAGKTTLLRALAGERSIDRGELSVGKGVRIALHDQRPPRAREVALRDYILSGCTEELRVEAQLAELEAAMAAGDADEALLERYARAQTLLETYGGYLWRDRASAMARGLGFAEDDLDRTLHTFSGGQLTRASLARALATRSDVLLLDEPTNHLDIESLEWLEQTLTGLEAAIVLVAHDRWFLEAVGTSVLELEAGRARFFAGPWHAWRREQAARELALGKAIDRQQAEIARMERFVERFRYKATKARQAQSRVKKLAKMQRIERDPRDGQALAFSFKPPARSGRVVFELTDALIQVGAEGKEITLLEGAELWLERGEHVSLVGPNGSGKTTLIETLAGRRPFARGKLSTGHNVTVGYLSQHADELGAAGGTGTNPDPSVLEATQGATGLTPNRARALLGRFLFSGDQADKPLHGLSGGERRRLSLAILVSSGANVLILDEPTNHLDIDSREALEDALRAFQGAILLVSHDRALLDAVGTRTIAVERPDGADATRPGEALRPAAGGPATLRSFVGGWPEYVRVREQLKTEPQAAPSEGPHVALPGTAHVRSRRSAHAPTGTESSSNGAKPKPKRAAKPKPKADGPSKNRLRDQQRAERQIEEAEAALRAVEDELADPAAWVSKYEAAKSEARHTAARRAVEAAYARLEALVE
jgi:ATP-binding cassette, subfamily F, member 3